MSPQSSSLPPALPQQPIMSPQSSSLPPAPPQQPIMSPQSSSLQRRHSSQSHLLRIHNSSELLPPSLPPSSATTAANHGLLRAAPSLLIALPSLHHLIRVPPSLHNHTQLTRLSLLSHSPSLIHLCNHQCHHHHRDDKTKMIYFQTITNGMTVTQTI